MAKNETKEIVKEFDDADVDSDGFLSKEEIRQMLDMHDETKVNELIKTMDTDQDGKVSYAEFASHFKSLMRKDWHFLNNSRGFISTKKQFGE